MGISQPGGLLITLSQQCQVFVARDGRLWVRLSGRGRIIDTWAPLDGTWREPLLPVPTCLFHPSILPSNEPLVLWPSTNMHIQAWPALSAIDCFINTRYRFRFPTLCNTTRHWIRTPPNAIHTVPRSPRPRHRSVKPLPSPRQPHPIPPGIPLPPTRPRPSNIPNSLSLPREPFGRFQAGASRYKQARISSSSSPTPR